MTDKENLPPSAVETIKDKSNYLRGGIVDGLATNTTGAIQEDDTALIKFHGIYQQDDRDQREERARRKLEPDYSFMLRLRVPGGVLSAAQWLAVDAAATTLTDTGSLRLTTRQTLQFHGIPKENLRLLVSACQQQLLDSIAACGDVNRNVMCSHHADTSPLHRAAYETAQAISTALLPATRAYFEIWLGEEQLANSNTAETPESVEPLYGKHYLPRKFKIGIAVPPANDIDVYSQDIGFVAIAQDGALCGFNVFAGGGLATTHKDARTYSRLGSAVGFCHAEQAVAVAWHIAAWQRDNGNRNDRKLARLKYTIDRRGLPAFRQELQQRLGFEMQAIHPMELTTRSDALGWRQRDDGLADYGLFIENGRIAAATPLQNVLRKIAEKNICQFMMTSNQNLLLIGLDTNGQQQVNELLATLPTHLPSSGLRENAMACVAFPTCPLAMAEAERYLPSLVTRLEKELLKHQLTKDAISIRMTGCPNGCARPYLGEIGLVGKAPGRYNLYLGASANGDRLGTLVNENMNEQMLLEKLSPLLAEYAHNRKSGESFGDFVYTQLDL